MSIKSITTLLIAAMLVTFVPSNALANVDYTSTANGNNQAALKLYSKLKNTPGNIVFSPYSISTALAMAYTGAKGNTAAEMTKALNYNSDPKKLDADISAITSEIKSASQSGLELNIANSLWIQKKFPVQKSFMDLTTKYFGPVIFSVDFAGAAEAVRKQINVWVEKQTKNKIKDLIKPGILNSLTRLVIVNAVYFNGTWHTPFKKELTTQQPFYLKPDKSVKAPLMTITEGFNYAETTDLQVLEMPYKGAKISMIVVLPKNKAGLAAVEAKLTGSYLESLFDKLSYSKVITYIPKFKTTSAFNLVDKLQQMGMKEAFSFKADLSGITGKKDLLITAVIHKAFIDVNEQGTEAAAATAVVIGLKSAMFNEKPNPTFRADHPFLYFIRHRDTNTILFAGRIVDPTK